MQPNQDKRKKQREYPQKYFPPPSGKTFDDNFDRIIYKLLAQGGITGEKAIVVYSPRKQEFYNAFTHSSYDNVNNYETNEFIGDTIFNLAVAARIKEVFPKIVNVEWLTRIKHYYVSNKLIAVFIRDAGWGKYLRYGEGLNNKIKSTSIRQDEQEYVYNKILADIVESVLGTIAVCVNASLKDLELAAVPYDVGLIVALRVAKWIIGHTEFSLDPILIFDPVTTLKKIYDQYNWGQQKNNTLINQTGESEWTYTLFGYPGGDKQKADELGRVIKENRRELAKIVTDEAPPGPKKDLAIKALKRLQDTYKMRFAPPDPYARRNK